MAFQPLLKNLVLFYDDQLYPSGIVSSPENMTDFTSSVWTITESVHIYDAIMGGDGWRVFNTNGSDGWLTNTSGAYITWHKNDLSDIPVAKYFIIGRHEYTQYPTGWILYGSNDGTTWDVVDTQSEQEPSYSSGGLTVTLDRQYVYKYWKLSVTSWYSISSLMTFTTWS